MPEQQTVFKSPTPHADASQKTSKRRPNAQLS
jgi:hypothetical protein